MSHGGMADLFNQLPGSHYIDFNISSLKWCSLISLL